MSQMTLGRGLWDSKFGGSLSFTCNLTPLGSTSFSIMTFCFLPGLTLYR